MTAEDKKKVWLSITGIVSDHRNEDKMVFSTEGAMYREHNDTPCLTYNESEVSGMEGTTTTVKVEGDKVSVIRLGAVNSIMEFEKGKRNVTLYSTPYGEIAMGIFTKVVNVDYNDMKDPVNVKVNYAIEVEGVSNSENTLDIKITNYH
ncbi:MAG: DUF1934 domain-containing protein [Eubacterium sp.]